MPDPQLRRLVIGAHPDDAEFKAGGLAALYRQLGHDVRFVSVTDGSSGNQQITGPEQSARRSAQPDRVAEEMGITYEIWDFRDGHLVPDLTARERVIRLIRMYRPDLVLTHRPNDYHPDHRAVGLLVQDAAYLLTVPPVCPETPHLRRDPVIAYLSDDFSKPYPFRPDVIVDVSAVFEDKVRSLHAHESQFYEWLPYNGRFEADVPAGDDDRRAWLGRRMAAISGRLADRHRPAIVAAYGEEAGSKLRLIEAFEGCEYGAPLDDEAIARLFPFSPEQNRG